MCIEGVTRTDREKRLGLRVRVLWKTTERHTKRPETRQEKVNRSRLKEEQYLVKWRKAQRAGRVQSFEQS